MINSLKSYNKRAVMPLSIDEMEKILKEMNEEIGNDEDALELYEELKEKAREYTNIRAGWSALSIADKAKTDPLRTAKHDSLITHFNMLARYLRNNEKKAAWRDLLGDPALDPENRKRIGDMGNYISFVEALNAR